jgi:tetratricopeptide (TPR) repeat protein
VTPDDHEFSEATRLLTRGDLAQAQAIFEDLLRRHPNHFDCVRRLAMIAVETGRHADAVSLCCQALEINPSSAEAYIDMGSAMLGLGQTQAALECLDTAIQLDGTTSQAHNNRGLALKALGRLHDAEACYRQAIALDAGSKEAWLNLGVVQRQLNHHDAALASYTQAIALQADYARAYVNRGLVLHDMGRLAEAIAQFDMALYIQPGMGEAYWNKALALLTLGDYRAAWPLYEWRWINHSAAPPSPDSTPPLWNGSAPLWGKRILVQCEQGLGDAIQFCRYLPLLADLGAEVIFEVYAPLVGLMQSLAGVAQVIPHKTLCDAVDYRVLLMSLPMVFETTVTSIPVYERYLSAPPDASRKWSDRLGDRQRKRVGLVWRGSPNHQDDRKRSLALDQLLAHLPPGFDYVSLQYQPSVSEQATLAQHGVIDPATDMVDFSDTAAICAQLDLVISVDTSVAHLSGALGIPCWILVTHNADWRWLMGRSDCVWYPKTRIHRQFEAGNWDSALEAVASDLRRAQ